MENIRLAFWVHDLEAGGPSSLVNCFFAADSGSLGTSIDLCSCDIGVFTLVLHLHPFAKLSIYYPWSSVHAGILNGSVNWQVLVHLQWQHRTPNAGKHTYQLGLTGAASCVHVAQVCREFSTLSSSLFLHIPSTVPGVDFGTDFARNWCMTGLPKYAQPLCVALKRSWVMNASVRHFLPR